MEAGGLSETSTSMYRTIRHNPQDVSLERTEIYSVFSNVLNFTATTLDFTTTTLLFYDDNTRLHEENTKLHE